MQGDSISKLNDSNDLLSYSTSASTEADDAKYRIMKLAISLFSGMGGDTLGMTKVPMLVRIRNSKIQNSVYINMHMNICCVHVC